ncbi:conserved hypothetical protein [Histoplasma capsulatum H143]|uniref:Uncharacterized protein n=1 Tax=Ajellomyces capsulatus (strain H143) TaxID=544712 RepID=C6HEW8_AJECH|nr:conserved hypothetical protein [Histoplasma capsulatum H143]
METGNDEKKGEKIPINRVKSRLSNLQFVRDDENDKNHRPGCAGIYFGESGPKNRPFSPVLKGFSQTWKPSILYHILQFLTPVADSPSHLVLPSANPELKKTNVKPLAQPRQTEEKLSLQT